MRQSTAVNNQNANAFRFSKQVNKTSWAPLLLFLDTYVEQKRSNGHAEKSWHRAVCLATAFTPFHFLLQLFSLSNFLVGRLGYQIL